MSESSKSDEKKKATLKRPPSSSIQKTISKHYSTNRTKLNSKMIMKVSFSFLALISLIQNTTGFAPQPAKNFHVSMNKIEEKSFHTKTNGKFYELT